MNSVNAQKGERRHLMILSSTSCQANCLYCFGPNRGKMMSIDILRQVVDWVDETSPIDEKIHLTFHGGEPLLVGVEWYQMALRLLSDRFGGRVSFSIQSNLWLLDEEFCSIFKKYKVSIGTSLDGPETITDQQRGKGYFQKTYHGIQLARKYGIEVGVICTFTPISARDMETVIDFFIQEGLPISIHVTTPVIGHNQSEWIFTPQGAGATYVKLFDLYLDKINKIEVRNFDALARGIACNRGSTCTFINCLGKHLSIGPEGEIFLCNRFAGHPHLQLGNILVHKKLSDLKSTSTWKKFAAREGNVAKDCGDCTHYDYCAGGCAFNTLSNSNGLRDPGCQAYKSIFDHIINCAAQEAIAPKNISALINTEKPEGLLRHGKLIDIMVGRSHRS